MSFKTRVSKGFAFLGVAVAVAILSVGILAGQNGIRERREDPARPGPHNRPTFTVLLEIDEAGIRGFFTEVSGLGSEHELIEHKVIDPNGQEIVLKIPGRLRFNDIVLKRGISSDTSLWQWRRLVETGGIADARADGKITLLQRGAPVATWRFLNAWPSKITGPDLNAEGNDVAIEEIVLVHEGMMRES